MTHVHCYGAVSVVLGHLALDLASTPNTSLPVVVILDWSFKAVL